MNSRTTLLLIGVSLVLSVWLSGSGVAQSGSQAPATKSTDEQAAADSATQINENSPTTAIEARGRARILHETLHGTLQVMHRDFFREDEGLKIPSRSLEDVFSELAETWGVKLHWIAVDLKAMSVDNEPETDFEKEAARVLKSGKAEYESVSRKEFRFAGRIQLSAICLSCHASRRSSNDERAAGLVITMPLNLQK